MGRIIQDDGGLSEEVRGSVSASMIRGYWKRRLSQRSCRFTLTPQRMRMIVEAFKDTLELGLEKPNQVVVCMFI